MKPIFFVRICLLLTDLKVEFYSEQTTIVTVIFYCGILIYEKLGE